MAAYLIAHVNPTDTDGFDEYRRGFPASLEPFGGRVVVADPPEPVEGDVPPGRVVVIEFADIDTAKAWYHSDEYQRLSTIRRAHSEGWLGLVEGR